MTAWNVHWHRVAAAGVTAVFVALAGPASAAAITFDTGLPVGEAPLVFRQAPDSPGRAGTPQEEPGPACRSTGDKDAQEWRDRGRTLDVRPRGPMVAEETRPLTPDHGPEPTFLRASSEEDA
jgi:hypothetical protein